MILGFQATKPLPKPPKVTARVNIKYNTKPALPEPIIIPQQMITPSQEATSMKPAVPELAPTLPQLQEISNTNTFFVVFINTDTSCSFRDGQNFSDISTRTEFVSANDANSTKVTVFFSANCP